MGAAALGSTVGVALGAAFLAGGILRPAEDAAYAPRLSPGAVTAYLDAPPPQDLVRAQPVALTLTSLRPAIPAPSKPAAPPRAMRELDCLAQAVYFEARGESPAGQAAVAQVVLNRVRHPAFPDSVCAVVYQGASRKGCQFSFACDGLAEIRREGAAWRRARRIAASALDGAVMAEVGQATHFHTTGVAPAWGPKLARVAQVGVHVFYRFGRSGGRGFPHAPPAEAPAKPQIPDVQLASAQTVTPAQIVVQSEFPAAETPKADLASDAKPIAPAAEDAAKPAAAKAS